MSRTRRMLVPALAIGLMLGAARAEAQVAGRGQQQRIQDRIHQMDEMVRRMDRVQDRVHRMDQAIAQDMERIRAHIREQERLRDPEAMHDQVREQDRMRDQDRLHRFERIREMSDGMGQMGRQMRATLMQMREMHGDPLFEGDPVMQREMEQLQERFRNMGDELEEGLQLMERLHQRVREGQPPQD